MITISTELNMAKKSFLLALLLVCATSRAQDNWPEFRGPNADGRSKSTGLPLKWSETENVRWKTAIHDRGWSTPVIWDNQVWLTTATEDGTKMFAVCVDRNSGKVLLDRLLFENAMPEPLGNDVNSYASPSPVIEAGRVYIHFGSYGTACLDTNSFKTVWQRRDLKCRHYRGPSSSPILFRDLLILTFDGADLQYTIALDKRTGKTIWRKDRSADWNDLDQSGKPTMEGDMRKAHSTPVLVTVGGEPRMVTTGAKAAYMYDPRNGDEIWKIDTPGFSASMRPVLHGGNAIVTTGYGNADLLAVPLNCRGKVQPTQVVWRYRKMVPQKPSPLVVDDLLYLINDSGVATCVDAKTGEPVWQERIGGTFSASPLYADGRIYLFSEQGKTTILSPGRKLEIIGENTLPSGFMASAAIAGKAFFLRTRTHLYRIEQ
jgi:outer membrane protein assembly factor BamB